MGLKTLLRPLCVCPFSQKPAEDTISFLSPFTTNATKFCDVCLLPSKKGMRRLQVRIFLFILAFAYTQAFLGIGPHQNRPATTTVYGSRVISTSRRPRRKDLTTAPPVQDEANDDGGGGGGKRWVRVWPVGMGQYGDNKACFLARRREVGDVEGSTFESLPVPLFDTGAIEMVAAAFQRRDQDVSRTVMQWAHRHMAVGRGREAGAFDNLPWDSWVGDEGVKKEAFNRFFGKDMTETLCPYGTLHRIIQLDLGGIVTDVLLDEEDSPRGPGITFGPVILIREVPLLSTTRPRMAVVDCTLDESIGFSLALDRPIAIPEDLYDGTVVPTRSLGRKGGIRQFEADVDMENQKRVKNLMAEMEAVKPGWEIRNSAEFWAMDARQKRLCLIKSGATNIPKRRYGPQELELALLPFLDETVRYEARLSLAMEAGDDKLVEKLVRNRSERSKIKDAIAAAMREGDLQSLQQLEERLQVLTDARYDITMEEGSYQRDMDQDEWYIKNRRI